MFSSFRPHLVLALRSLRRRPAFSLGVTLVLALGIGASAAMLTLVHHVLLAPLPYPDPDRLVWGWGTWRGGDRVSVSPPDYLDYREESRSFASLAAMNSFLARFNLSGGGPPERVGGAFVSANFLDTLGLTPALGRSFTVEEEVAGAEPVAMIGYGLWQRRFGGDPSVVGSTLQVDGQSRTVIGVLPAGLDFPADAEIWQPIPFRGPETSVRRFHFLRVIGRLAPEVTLGQAQAEVDAIARRLEAAYPGSNETWRMSLVPLHERMVGSARVPLLVLLGAVGLVLLIACANVATLLLVRAFGRRAELAVRSALGASRSDLLGGLLAESLVLGFAGAALGFAGASVLLSLAGRFAPDALPRLAEVQVDATVLLAVIAVTAVSLVLAALAPAWRVTRRDVSSGLRPGRRAAGTGLRARGRSVLVVAQVAMSVTLLIAALLLLRSYAALQAVDPGFEPRGLVVAEVPLPRVGYEEDHRRVALFSELLQRVSALPGVERVAGAEGLPLVSSGGDTRVWRADRSPQAEGEDASVLYPQIRHATPDYFASLRIPRVRGRVFRESDGLDAPPVALLNETAARQLFDDGEDPLGRQVVVDLGDPWTAEVIGVVGDTRLFGLANPAPPAIYLPQWQQPTGVLRLAIGGPASGTTSGPAAESLTAALAPALRRILDELDPELPLTGLERYEDRIADTLAAGRLQTGLLTAFAIVALVLAALGLYGLLTFLVGQRTREMGIRMALGALRGDVLRLVLGRGAVLVGPGLVFGVVASMLLAGFLRSLLFGVSVVDPVALVVGPAVLAVVALVASLVPAHRASRVEPVTALRAD